MATTETITLAQALKLRKRLAERMGQVDQRIAQNNSIPQGNVRDASPRELLSERGRLIEQLVALKVATSNVMAPGSCDQALKIKAQASSSRQRAFPETWPAPFSRISLMSL